MGTGTATGGSAAHDDFVAHLRAHAGIVRKVAATYGRRAEDRRDLEQEIVAQLWRAFPAYDRARPFPTWAYRIALNVAISFARSDVLRGHHDADVDVEAVAEIAGDDGNEAERDHALAQLRAFIAGLDPLHRALMLLYLDERSYREIADILGISETNVATKINRVKQKLRAQLTLGEPS